MFVYGIGTKRQKYRDTFTEKGVRMMVLGTLACALSALLLCYVRKRYRLRRSGFGATYVDLCCVMTGGGNLNLRHRWERIIFTVLFIGYFFFTNFWLEAVVFLTFLIHDGSIDTFDELKQMNPPIFNSILLEQSEQFIGSMLRFGPFNLFIVYFLDCCSL